MADVLRQGRWHMNLHAVTSVDNYAVVVGKLWLLPCVWIPPPACSPGELSSFKRCKTPGSASHHIHAKKMLTPAYFQLQTELTVSLEHFIIK